MVVITTVPEKFSGELFMPGDKSITHRALMLGALAHGITEVRGFLDAEDCRSTINCLRALGVKITIRGERMFVEGRNYRFCEPDGALDAGNSGTTARLLFGLLAGQPFRYTVVGDSSLQARPMRRVVEPLQNMGVSFESEGESNGDSLPLTVCGGTVRPLHYESPRASAQVKSTVLLAGLYAAGETSVTEPAQSRNHTELMLTQFGARVQNEDGRIVLQGRPFLRGGLVKVPGDISAAAFFMVAAALIPGSEVLLKNVGINETRRGIIDVLLEMGVALELRQKRFWGKESVADILIKGGGKLKGISIGGEMIPRLIDEIPVLAVAAAVAEGKTVIKDAGELRVKESDRIATLCSQLSRLGAKITETGDGMIIEGGVPLKGHKVDACGDHRIAMALAVAGLAAEGDTVIEGAEVIAVSFPDFMAAMRSLVTK